VYFFPCFLLSSFFMCDYFLYFVLVLFFAYRPSPIVISVFSPAWKFLCQHTCMSAGIPTGYKMVCLPVACHPACMPASLHASQPACLPAYHPTCHLACPVAPIVASMQLACCQLACLLSSLPASQPSCQLNIEIRGHAC
jgi:hypothetical protein